VKMSLVLVAQWNDRLIIAPYASPSLTVSKQQCTHEAFQSLIGRFSVKKALGLMLLTATYLPAATLKDAYVNKVARPTGQVAWRLGNARIKLEISYIAGQLRLSKLVNPQTGTNWTPSDASASIAQLVEFRSGGKEYTWEVPEGGAWKLQSQKSTSDQNTVGLELVFKSTRPGPILEVSFHYRVYPHSFVETWTEMHNVTPGADSRLEVLRVGRSRVVVGAGESRFQVADSEGTKYGEPLQFDWRPLGADNSVVLPQHGSAGPAGQQGFIRGFILRRDSRETLMGGVYYGHRSPLGFGMPESVRFAHSGDSGAVEVEIVDGSDKLGDKREVLRAGFDQYVKGLTTAYTFAGGELSSVNQAYHELARYKMPPPPTGAGQGFPWVEDNMYFGYDLGFNARDLKRDVDIAAELGAEAFIVDAGWWENALQKCEIVTTFSDYLVRIGEYTPDFSSRFPTAEVSFKDFSDYVHAKGMRFGLWLCPFNVDTRYKSTGWDPSWLAQDGHHLCAAHRPAFEWVKSQISQLVRDYHVDFLKFDCETADRCDNPNHETVRRIGSREYVVTAHDGYSDLIAALREEFPTVALESTLPLGHVAASTDDWDLSPERGRAEIQKARFIDPPQYTAQYLMLEPAREKGMSSEEYLGYTNYVIRSNILGHIILSSELAAWRPRFREAVRQHIEIYRHYRGAFTGQTYELAFDPGWESTQFRDPQTDVSVVVSFRKPGGGTERHLTLQRLQAEQTYEVTFEDRNDVLRLTGKQLMEDGLRLGLSHPRTSEIMYVQPVGPGPARRMHHTTKEWAFARAVRSVPEAPPAVGSPLIHTEYAPYLESANAQGLTVVFGRGSDFDPDTYDWGFDGNVGTIHIPLTRLASVCPTCVPADKYCGPEIWNCHKCPHLKNTPGHPDTDGDGLPDWWEDLFGRDMKPHEDNDGDALDNLTEYWNMTDPLSPDTDGDGWNDALELASFNTDPLRKGPGGRVVHVDPNSKARAHCGSRENPCGSLAAAVGADRFEGRTLILVAAGTLQESVQLSGELSGGASLGIFGGFDPRTWERRGEGTTLQSNSQQRALTLAPRSSHQGLIVVEGFTIKGGLLIEEPAGGATSFRISRNRIVGASAVPGIEVRGDPRGRIQLFNDLISGNKGGIASVPAWLLVMNCTVENNNGPGIAITGQKGQKYPTWASSINNVVWGNTNDLVGMDSVVATLCREESHCIPTSQPSPEGTGPPPQALRDSGVSVPGFMPLLDLEGKRRVTGGGVDLGAIELDSTP
jgi:hypothetical protein